jgi:hypothetical protein
MNSVIVDCENCGQKNRVALPLPDGKAVQCGKCHEPGSLDAALADEGIGPDADGFDDDDEGGL